MYTFKHNILSFSSSFSAEDLASYLSENLRKKKITKTTGQEIPQSHPLLTHKFMDINTHISLPIERNACNFNPESESDSHSAVSDFWQPLWIVAHRLQRTGSSVHRILQGRILEWVAISFSINPDP